MIEAALWNKFSDKEYREVFSEGLVDDRLSAQIFYLRKHRGWTQRELSRRSGVSQTTISALEDSADGARVSTLRKIAAAFDVVIDAKFISFAEFVGASGDSQISKNIPPYNVADTPARSFRGKSVEVSPDAKTSQHRVAHTTSAEPVLHVAFVVVPSQGSTSYV